MTTITRQQISAVTGRSDTWLTGLLRGLPFSLRNGSQARLYSLPEVLKAANNKRKHRLTRDMILRLINESKSNND